jgi:hypothetical protein
MDETDPVPAGEQPDDTETHPSEEAAEQAQRQVVPGKSESEPPPEDPGAGGWVPV